MLLAVDVGNTTINNGVFEGNALKNSFRIQTNAKDLRARYSRRLNQRIETVVIVSVVPKVLRDVKEALKRFTGAEILVVGKDVNSGIKNLYKNPEQVGQDRLVNARAAYELYGGSIIVDFGTAVTIDIVTKDRKYLGGLIAPGVEISLDALSERAALLPRVVLRKPRGVLGRETRQSMINGAVYGFSSLCDGIVQRLKMRYGRRKKVIATGGMSPLIGPYCKSVDRIDPELTLKGLRLIGDESRV